MGEIDEGVEVGTVFVGEAACCHAVQHLVRILARRPACVANEENGRDMALVLKCGVVSETQTQLAGLLFF